MQTPKPNIIKFEKYMRVHIAAYSAIGVLPGLPLLGPAA